MSTVDRRSLLKSMIAGGALLALPVLQKVDAVNTPAVLDRPTETPVASELTPQPQESHVQLDEHFSSKINRLFRSDWKLFEQVPDDEVRDMMSDDAWLATLDEMALKLEGAGCHSFNARLHATFIEWALHARAAGITLESCLVQFATVQGGLLLALHVNNDLWTYISIADLVSGEARHAA